MSEILSRLAEVDPREVWAHEAHNFTPWLLENESHLAEVLGIELELTANEHRVGSFSLDLVGEDHTHDCPLIVENQLATTDHSHLGQLITYAAGTGAATVVWMATRFQEEHRQALDYLNEISGDEARFFGVEIAVVRIDDSLPAPLFRLAAKPNDWRAEVASATKAAKRTGGRGPLYLRFWHAFMEEAERRGVPWYRPRKPQPQNWMDLHYFAPSGGVRLSVSFARGGRLRAELYIDTGDLEVNSAIFEALHEHRLTIEAAFGEPLAWHELPNRRASRLAWYGEGEIVDEAAHPRYIDELLDKATRLFEACPELIERVVRDAVADGQISA